MREIEIKATLRDTKAVLEKLRGLGCEFSPSMTQDDTVYAEDVSSLEAFNANEIFLRLRTVDGKKVVFTMKAEHGTKRGPDTTPIEHETVIEDRAEMEEILHRLGFKEAVRTRKTRQKTTYEKWEICIDDVEELGSFIELEEMAGDDVDAKKVHEAMFEFLASLGISREDMLTERYDILLLQKQGKG